MKANPAWHSSYEKNNYGDIFCSLVRIYKPKSVIELGTKSGYSACYIARGLKKNRKGTLTCYDLWEKYQFHAVPKKTAQENLKKYRDIIKLKQRNAIGAEKLHKSVDILHIDLSNEGEILEKIVPFWINKVRQFIIIEGGSSERDKVDWMVKYNKEPIKKWLENFGKKNKIKYFTITPFPSITLIYKNGL